MGYRSALMHVVADRGGDGRLRMTVGIARELGCEILGLGAQAPWPYSHDSGRGSDFEQIETQAREEVASAAAMFKGAMNDPGIAGSWRDELGYPEEVIARHAR